MKLKFFILNVVLVAAVFLLFIGTIKAQTVTAVSVAPTDELGNVWSVEIAFSQIPKPEDISKYYLLNVDDTSLIQLGKLEKNNFGYQAITLKPLETILPPGEKKRHLKNYLLNIFVKNSDGKFQWQTKEVELLDETVAVNHTDKKKAKDVDDADVYIAGEVGGSHKQKTTFTTEIKLQKYKPIGSWRLTPFFKLNASTDPNADPDSMEIGYRFRRINGENIFPATYLDNEVKIESERDFGNTNLIGSSRLTFLPAGLPRDKKSKYKFFAHPFIGTELGKNLRSPLKTAEGDGIARVLAGADFRLVIFLNKENGKGINWRTSYTRRWLLTDELSFKADKDGNLILVRFGKNPRDFVESKLIFNFNKFFGSYIGYDWGQIPPSYKLIDHRFRLGFVYKYKFGIK